MDTTTSQVVESNQDLFGKMLGWENDMVSPSSSFFELHCCDMNANFIVTTPDNMQLPCIMLSASLRLDDDV
jgi:hypothetical protein